MADLEYEWITYDDLKKILSDVSFLNKEEYESLSSLDQIEKLCLLYNQMYQKAEIEFIKKDNNSLYKKYSVNSPFQKIAEECFLLGFNIVYRLRAFLFQEDIKIQEMMFSSGNPVGIFEKNITDLLKNNQIKTLLNQGEIKLDVTLTKVKVEDLKKDHLDRWNKILQYTGMGSLDEFAAEEGDTFEYNQKIYQRYRHQKDSRNVIFTGNPNDLRSIKYYYMYSDNNYMNFNRGNLFEWFESTLSHYSESTIKSLGTKSLFEKIMEKHETEGIAGYKQGDYYSKEESQWIQSKYGNHTLGQIRDIHNVIMSSSKKKGILQIIQNYKHQEDILKANKQIQEDFLKLFTTAKDKVNRDFDDKLKIKEYLNLEKQNKIIANLGII